MSKKPGVTFWAAVFAAVALVAYPLSFGPACWLASRHVAFVGLLPRVYRPIICVWDHSPRFVGEFLGWYTSVGAPDWYRCGKGEASNWARVR